jgi:hypothetical protein
MTRLSKGNTRHRQAWPVLCFVSMLIWTASLAGQEQAASASGSAVPQLTEIARSVKTLYISGREGFVGIPSEPLEKKLFEYPEFQKGELILLHKPEGADVLVELDRKSGTWDFTYTMTHRKSGIVLGAGKVIAWDGVRAGTGLAKQIMKRLRELRSPEGPGKQNKKKS